MDVKDILAPLDVEIKKVSLLGGDLAVIVVPLEHADAAMRAKREMDTAIRCGDFLVLGAFGMNSDEASAHFISIPKGISTFPKDATDAQALFFQAVERLNSSRAPSPWARGLWEGMRDMSFLGADGEDRFLKSSFYQFAAFMAERPDVVGRLAAALGPSDRHWLEDVLPARVVDTSGRDGTGSDGDDDVTSIIESWNFKEKFAAKVELGRSTLRRFRTIEHLFTLPSISLEIIEAASDPLSAAFRMARIIEKDPVLTSRVLKVVNSAFYGFRRQIVSVERAVVILGNDEVVNLAFSIAVHQIMDRIAPRHAAVLWEHSLMTAHLAQWLGGQFGCAGLNEMYTAGLLHDFGKIVFLQKGATSAGITGMSTVADLALEERETGLSHAEMGAYVAERWNLPEDLVDTLLTHHLPGNAKDVMRSVVVHLADALAHNAFIPFDDINAGARRALGGACPSLLPPEVVSRRYDYTLKRVRTLLELER